MKNVEVALDFVKAINNADVDKIYDLMTENHLFIDSQDNRVEGKEKMRKAWIGYFALFPDYKIEINEIVEKESLVCLYGYASGTFRNIKKEKQDSSWRIPAAWTAVIINDRVKQWQVYADNSVLI